MFNTSTIPKRVCVVGAGPSGIVAAKALMHDFPKGVFEVTVFEKSDNIGGLWPLSKTDSSRINPLMRTNLSHHTVAFSDQAWPESSPTFPQAWQVGQYLKRYVDSYPDLNIRTGCNVVSAKRSPGGFLSDEKWTVEVQMKGAAHTNGTVNGHSESASSPTPTLTNGAHSLGETGTETHTFDHLIVASGFFGTPKIPEDLPGIEKLKQSGVAVIHSLNFHSISDVLGNSQTGDKILVLGGQMSGAEVAASIAMQLSSDVHSPKGPKIKDSDKYTVHHVIKRPFWVLPSHLPVTPTIEEEGDEGSPVEAVNPAPTFLPLDLSMYELSKRPPGELWNQSGHISESAAQAINNYMQRTIGSDQSNIPHGEGLAVTGPVRNDAPRIAITDGYTEFVRSGMITVHTGTIKAYSSEDEKISASNKVTLSDGSVIDNVAAIVFATGHDARGALAYLDDSTLSSLDYDPNCSMLPLNLSFHSTHNPAIPSLGFIGFYRGPYWGIMENQARFLGQLWSSSSPADPSLIPPPSAANDTPALRKLFYSDRNHLAQFPMGDYIYHMESLADSLKIGSPNGLCPFRSREGPVIPARYLPASASAHSKEQSAAAISHVEKILKQSASEHRFVACAIFRGLQGVWKLRRSIDSKIATFPSGTFNGTANFWPREPTSPEFDSELLYHEEGEFIADNGLRMRANRGYAYRYTEATDTLSAWFVKQAEPKVVDYLFHDIELLEPQEDRWGRKGGWRGRAIHPCVKDIYEVEYEFFFRGAGLYRWTLAYDVKGPAKDYRIVNEYVR